MTLRAKTCRECGGLYSPNSGRQERCNDCRKPKAKGQPVRTARRKPAAVRHSTGSMRLRDRIREIEQESYERFRAEKEADGEQPADD